MTNLTNLTPGQSYADLLTLDNELTPGVGLSDQLKNIQDGNGVNTPMQIATNSINFIRTNGNTIQFDEIEFTADVVALNTSFEIGSGYIEFTWSNKILRLPAGTTAQRPDDGTETYGIRYNTEANAIECYIIGQGWRGVAVGTPQGISRLQAITGDTPDFSFSDTGLRLAAGTTAQRPDDNDYIIRYNTDADQIEAYVKEGSVFGWYNILMENATSDNIFGYAIEGVCNISFNEGALWCPQGTTAERANPEKGLFRYNTDTDEFEGYINGVGWKTFQMVP